MTGGRPDGRSAGRWFLAAATLLTAGPPVRLSAQWRPEDRIVITDFSSIVAVAASPTVVFAATTHGLALYDRQAHAWRPPVTALDGYPAARVRAALADVLGDAVWLGTADGWARFDADLLRWDGAPLPGGVAGLMLDATDPASGIFLQTVEGWMFLPRGGLVPVPGRPLPPPGRRIAPLSADAALNRAPVGQAFRALILTDARLRSYRWTAAASSPDQSDMFFGTNGAGLFRIDPVTAEWERLPFGLLTERAGGIALASEGVWVASLSRGGERRGLTWIAADLSAGSMLEAEGIRDAECAEGRRVLAIGPRLWVACERGVLEIDTATHRRRLFDFAAGLPSDDVLSVAPAAPDASSGVWVGTARGLAIVTPDEKVASSGFQRDPVYALLALRDTLWVGSAAGLGVVRAGSRDVVVPPDVLDQPALRAPVLLLARVGDTLVVATAEQLAWREPGSRAWTFLRAPLDLGTATALTGDWGEDGAGVWIGGTGGIAFWDFAHRSIRSLHVPFDVPAPVHDVAVDARYLWVSTDSGLVRFTRAAVAGR